ncbi:hypothetical protein KFL_000850330 [Klebsormidium nitens]|uniref:SUN domain-containing protein n=1 Tax=Klebsormidium nitens TaxID=105231 RepID=A0A1Y1HYK0_KLENI|nr:hypothetical protein KFL_000850330 [Klebsormidium nitens]|eukprot:GAQ81617.1 hypothetical protein KFL_000850330 [Klebsormidium nitens]
MESRLEGQLKKLGSDMADVRTKVSGAEAVLAKLSVEGAVVSRQEVLALAKSVVDQRAGAGKGGVLDLEDVRAAARRVVLDELERHSADRLGRPDHAVYSSGGRVLAHSAAWHTPGFGGLLSQLKLGLHPQAQRVVQPSHGEPGHCLPLKVLDGSYGHVDVALRTSVVPEAITLEHVSKTTAFDLSTAPKAFRISGWHNEPAKAAEPEVLGTFEYDTSADYAAQMFTVKPGPSAGMAGYNVVRLEVLSNYGSEDFTCIYRLRVHGIPLRA